jgi:hypothetical protein
VRLALINREKLQALGSALVAEFDNLVARIRTGWGVEHDETGSHTEVHAETVTTGRLVFADIVTDTLNVPQVHNYNPPGLSTASVVRIDPAIDWALLTGMLVPQDAAGSVLDGRVVILENVSENHLLRLAHETSPEGQASFARNRFRLPTQPTLINAQAEFVVPPASLVTLVYNATKARWILAAQSLETSVAFQAFAAPVASITMSGSLQARTWRLIPQAPDLYLSAFEWAGLADEAKRTIVNDGTFVMAFIHADANVDATRRIYCPGGVRYLLHPRESVEIQRMRGGGWRVLAKADQWIDVPYSSANFTADAGTWTVESADINTLMYHIDGNKMTLAWTMGNVSIAGSPTHLYLRIPDGRVSARYAVTRLAFAYDGAGYRTNATAVAFPGGGTINFQIDPFASGPWADVVNGAYFQGQLTFMIYDTYTMAEAHTDIAHADVGHADAEHGDVTHQDIAHVDSHGDVTHSDGTHTDVTHNDFHQDQIHTDTHSDVAHVDTHSDVAHQDQAHVDFNHLDWHSDVAHQDGAHSDVPFHDTPFVDSHSDNSHDDTHYDWAHSDSHNDVAHDDFHDDYMIYVGQPPVLTHVDTHNDRAHGDSHNDTPHDDAHIDVPHGDSHSDQRHDDQAHSDVAHQDRAHEDEHTDYAALYTPHYDVPHTDLHTDGAHSDAHSDIAHVDTHTDVAHSDSSHGDIAHSDSHTDTPHTDTLHTDQGHQDAGHGDATHQDQGLHSDAINHVDI